MPVEYGNKRSISIYLDKDIIKELELQAEQAGMFRSKFIVELIKKGLRMWEICAVCNGLWLI